MNIPTPVDFLLKTSLYASVDLSGLTPEEFHSFIEVLINPFEQFETICVTCRRNRLFKLTSAFETVSSSHKVKSLIIHTRKLIDNIETAKSHGPENENVQKNIMEWRNSLDLNFNRLPELFHEVTFFSTEYNCSFSNAHSMIFIFYIQNNSIMKIGQYPSFADLSEPQVEQYRNLLGHERFRDLTRALGLYAHGIGAGSFVYLRRIFEHLLDEANQKALSIGNYDEEDFKGKRVVERIKLLEDFLPPFIVKNRKLYSILSFGVHTLDDQKCLQYFPLVRSGIELILDEEIRHREEEEKVKAIESELDDLIKELEDQAG